MKLNKKIRKELLSKLGFDLGEFQLPKIDLEKLTSEPLAEQTDSGAPYASVQPATLSDAEKNAIIARAMERAVDEVLDRILQENDPEINNL